jgi:hypothetical protein
MGVNTLKKSCKGDLLLLDNLVIFGCFWAVSDGLEIHEEGELLAGLCPEVAEERLETGGWRTEGSTTEDAEDTER